ncbi:cytochrome c oxidase subunit 3, partial [Bacillus sp. S34]|nr:cytochrome c oxidase subunit 3 [Bacillus sp. S34]
TTGFHGLHVTGGLIAFLLTLGRGFAAKNFGHKEATTAIVVSYYWHFVDVVWIGLVLVVRGIGLGAVMIPIMAVGFVGQHARDRPEQ